MATRARVGILESDGTVTSIYTHWDGYVDHHGPILRDHYKTEEKVRALMALGDVSSLGAEIGEKHNFDAAPDGVCNAYGRDRGERDCESRRQTRSEFEGQQFYSYLFDPTKLTWQFIRKGDAPKDLAEAITEEEARLASGE
jgi:hypothetical protein